MSRKWDSLNPDTIYGDAAARVLCRIAKAEPSGRTLQQCLDAMFIQPDTKIARRNARDGDGTFTLSSGRTFGIECKASMNGTANVCISAHEEQVSEALMLMAWVPATDEIYWSTTMFRVRETKHWLENQGVWLICRDKIGE